MSDEKYRAILEKDPTDTQAFVALCNSAERNNDYQYLASLYDFRAQVIADSKEIADLHFRAGEIYLDKLNDLPQGVEALLKGFEADRTHAGIGDRLDAVYRDAGDWESAVQIAEQRLDALAQADANGTKLVIRSDLHQQAGEIWDKVYSDRSKALQHYKKAIELDKTNILALYGAREIYYQAGKFKNAAKLCELEARAERDLERRSALYRELSHIFEKKLANPDQAVIALKRALKSDPKNRELKIELANLIQTTESTRENEKDHKWAFEYLTRLAASGASLAPDGSAMSGPPSIAPGAAGAFSFPPDATIETASMSVPPQAPTISRGPSMPPTASQAPAAPAAVRPPTAAPASLAPSAPAAVRPPSAPPSTAPMSRPAAVSPAMSFPSQPSNAPSQFFESPDVGEPPFDSFSQAAGASAPMAPMEGEVPPRSAGLSDEEYASQLRMAADKARRSGNEDLAEDCLKEVLAISPYDQKAMTYLERRYRSRSDWLALRDLLLRSTGATHLPQAVQTVRLREAARLSEEQLSDVEGAISAWKTIKDNDPKVRDAKDALVRLFDQAQRWDELIALLQDEVEATKSRAKKVEAIRQLATIYYERMDDYEAAAGSFYELLQLAPDDQAALEALDRIYTQNGNDQELVALLRKRADLTQNRDEKRDYLYRAAVVYRERMGLRDEAYAIAKEILGFTKNDYGILEFMTSLDEEGENWSRLLTLLDIRVRVAQTDEEKVELLREKATVALERLDDVKTATKALNDLLDVDGDDLEAMTTLSGVYREEREWENLVRVLDRRIKALADDADIAQIRKEAARVLENELGREDQAMEYWNAVLDYQPDSESLGALARYYKRSERWDEYVDLLERQATYAQDHAERAQILFDRAEIIDQKMGDRDRAVMELKRVLNEVDPTHDGSLNLLTGILVEKGEFEEAADLLEQRISYTQDKSAAKTMLVQLGEWSRDELNDLERAMEAYERAVHLDREDEGILKALDEVYVNLKEWDKLLKLVYAEVKKTANDQERSDILLRGAKICEEELSDKKKAWTWYVEMLDGLGHLPSTVEIVEEAARRMELWNELIDLAAAMTRKAPLESDQVEWWLKAADVFEVKLSEPDKALEAVLRAFGLEPDNRELLERVDRLAVTVGNWKRLETVYGVLVKRAENKEEKIALLKRYALVLKEQGMRPAEGFDISVKAFELDPNSDELLAMVEEMGRSAERWEDLVKIYNACARMAEELPKKVDLKMRAANILRDEREDPDGALVAIIEALRFDPLDGEVTKTVWDAVEKLEADLVPTESGTYWNQLIETYRMLVDENRRDQERQIELLLTTSRVYIEKLKDIPQAFQCLKETQQLRPRDEGIIDKLEEIAAEHKFWDELTEHYQDILDETFEMEIAVMLHRRRARILEEELGRPEEAAEHYWQIIQLDSTDNTGYDKLLAYYEGARMWNELVNMLERKLDATKEDEDKRDTLLKIASIWENNIKNKYEAHDWYEQALTLWPDDEEAIAGVARLKREDDESDDVDDDLGGSLMGIGSDHDEEDEEEAEEDEGEAEEDEEEAEEDEGEGEDAETTGEEDGYPGTDVEYGMDGEAEEPVLAGDPDEDELEEMDALDELDEADDESSEETVEDAPPRLSSVSPPPPPPPAAVVQSTTPPIPPPVSVPPPMAPAKIATGGLAVAKPAFLNDVSGDDEEDELDGETGGNLDLGNLFDDDIEEDDEPADAGDTDTLGSSGGVEDILDATDLLEEDGTELILDDDDLIDDDLFLEEDAEDKG